MEAETYHNHNLDLKTINSIKVWVSVVLSLCFCYVSSKVVPKGLPRLLTFIPVVCLFLALPLNANSMHFGGLTAFFIAWLANFKLLLLAFGKGPLSDEEDPSLSLLKFIAISCLPIKIKQQNPSPNTKNKHNPSSQNGHNEHNPPPKTTAKTHKSLWNYAIKVLLLALSLPLFGYQDQMHPKFQLCFYCLNVYLYLEISQAVVAALVRATMGLQLEPQFNEPFLATSLQDFWGRRWNVMVPRILRPTVYEPTLAVFTPIVGRMWAPLPAMFCTFTVSALMHVVMLFYLGRTWPSWHVTWFFLLHGVCSVVELGVKKMLKGRCQLPPVISSPLTLGFVLATGFWLFLPQVLLSDANVRISEQFGLLRSFGKKVVGGWGYIKFNSSKL